MEHRKNVSFITRDLDSDAQLTSARPSRASPSLATNALLAQVPDHLSLGVILVQGDARVIYMNKSAAEIVASQSGLLVHKRILKTTDDGETARLKALIRRAAFDGNEKGGAAGYFALSVSRDSDARALPIIVAGLKSAGLEVANAERCAVIFVSDPDLGEAIPMELLRSLYGLTAAEAGISLGLLEGKGLEPAASAASMKLNTAKTHLKRVFEKTHTGRQAELVRVMLKTAGFLRFD